MSGDPAPDPATGGERQAPFYCPYCGEEELAPDGPDAGHWQCGACARAFQLRFRAVVAS